MISFVWGGVDKHVTQPWGYTTLTVEPLLNGRHFHCGIDVGDMPIGTRLHAARPGRVGYVGTGLLAIEVSGTGQTDWYIHIDRVLPGIAVGVQVSRGEFVAYSGNKVPGGGFTTGPHLHYEIQNSPVALVRRRLLGILLPIRPGEMNNPASSLDPVPVLEGRFSLDLAPIHQEDDMLYVTPFVSKPVNIRAFVAGSIYSDPTPGARVVGSFAKDATIATSGYVYSSAPLASPDLSASAGTQAGPDPIWWRVAAGWVADADLDTSKLVGAPSINPPPSAVWSNYFALANANAVIDVAAIAAAVVKQLPAYATPDQIAKAISDKLATARITVS